MERTHNSPPPVPILIQMDYFSVYSEVLQVVSFPKFSPTNLIPKPSLQYALNAKALSFFLIWPQS